MSRTNIVILVVYGVLIGLLVSGLFAARSSVLNRRDTATSQEDWEQWRREASRQSDGQGPVTRRPPRATEPPTVLLLRDHFSACLTLTLVISTVLFATMALMIRGVLFGPTLQIHNDADNGPGK